VGNTQYPHIQDLSSLNTVNEPVEGGGEGVLFFSRGRIFEPFKEPRSRFPAWRASTTTLLDVPARPPGYKGWRNRFLGSSGSELEFLNSLWGLGTE
jgi:hypothetical protein